MGAPDDIATVAVFLASAAAGYMTGETIVVDGGRLLT
jgi:3-oxoacyl-[acyl-carrier protein] reductase